MIDAAQDAAGWAVTLLFLVWFVLHFLFRSCSRAGCFDSPIAWVVTDHGGRIGRGLVEIATVGEWVIFAVALIGLAAGAVSRRT